MRDVIDVVFDDGVVVRGAARVRAVRHVRARPPRRPPGRGHREPASRPRRIDRRRRRRQGRTLHHGRRLVPPAPRVPRRQPRRAAGKRVGAAGDPAQRCPDVRRADAGHLAQARGDPAQGLRVRLDGHGHDRVRRPVVGVRLPRRHDGRDGRGRDESGRPAPTRTRPSDAAARGARGVVPLGERARLRRADRSPRDPQRAAPRPRARPLAATAGRRTGCPRRRSRPSW